MEHSTSWTGECSVWSHQRFCAELGRLEWRRTHSTTAWKRARDAVIWIHLAKAQEKGLTFGEPNRIPSFLTRQCRLIAPRERYLRKVRRLYINDSLHQGQLQEWHQQQHGDLGSFGKLKREVLRKLRETATRTVLQERRTRFKSISECMECHKKPSTRTRSA